MPRLIRLEHARDRVGERLEEDGHLLARKHESRLEYSKALGKLGRLELEIVRRVENFLDELITLDRLCLRVIVWSVEDIPKREVEGYPISGVSTA